MLVASALPCAFARPSFAEPNAAASAPIRASATTITSAPVRAPASASAPARGSASTASSAPAFSPATADIMVLRASNGGGGIDAHIGDLRELKRPPFSAYDTYRLIGQSRVVLAPSVDAPAPLPDGGVVHMIAREAAGGGRRKLAISISKPDGSVFLRTLEVTTNEGEPFFVAGYQQKDGGVLVLGIRVSK